MKTHNPTHTAAVAAAAKAQVAVIERIFSRGVHFKQFMTFYRHKLFITVDRYKCINMNLYNIICNVPESEHPERLIHVCMCRTPSSFYTYSVWPLGRVAPEIHF